MSTELLVTGRLPEGVSTKSISYFILDTARSAIVGQVMLPDVALQKMSVSLTVRVPPSAGPFAIGTFDAAGTFVPAAFLSVNAAAAPGGGGGP